MRIFSRMYGRRREAVLPARGGYRCSGELQVCHRVWHGRCQRGVWRYFNHCLAVIQFWRCRRGSVFRHLSRWPEARHLRRVCCKMPLWHWPLHLRRHVWQLDVWVWCGFPVAPGEYSVYSQLRRGSGSLQVWHRRGHLCRQSGVFLSGQLLHRRQLQPSPMRWWVNLYWQPGRDVTKVLQTS